MLHGCLSYTVSCVIWKGGVMVSNTENRLTAKIFDIKAVHLHFNILGGQDMNMLLVLADILKKNISSCIMSW